LLALYPHYRILLIAKFNKKKILNVDENYINTTELKAKEKPIIKLLCMKQFYLILPYLIVFISCSTENDAIENLKIKPPNVINGT
tara:strand:- start:165 stop:419 length:255 start_codon:yes stop_codon:yes gene_type:complete